MNPGDLFVGEGATLREALERVSKTGKGLALVVDAERRLLGIATDGDLRKAILRGVPLAALVDEAMNRSPIVGAAGISTADALGLMRSRAIRQLPIVDDRRNVVDVLFFEKLLEPQPLPNAAVIMAGGTGSRLRPLTAATPKPLLTIGGKPLLEIMIERLRIAGFRQIFMTLHYMSHVIREYFGDGTRFGVSIESALFLARAEIDGDGALASLEPDLLPRGFGQGLKHLFVPQENCLDLGEFALDAGVSFRGGIRRHLIL